MRMAIPAAFTTKNIPNWCRIWRDRESGYVQYRLKKKLLKTAQTNEIVPAYTRRIFRKCVNRFMTPKSIIAPIAPTVANLNSPRMTFLS